MTSDALPAFRPESLLSGDTALRRRLARPRGRFRRIILVANNPAVAGTALDTLGVGRGDLVLHFNRALHAAALMGLPARHVLCLRRHFATDQHHGFPPDPALAALLEAHQERVGLLFTGVPPREPSGGPAVVLDEAGLMRHLPDYPLRPGVHFSSPSTGYLLLRFMLLARGAPPGWPWRMVWRRAAPVLLVGFFDTADAKLWIGHSWEYERDWLGRHARAAGPVAEIV